jgi:uncharacterized membrane protein (UPF0127 family)
MKSIVLVNATTGTTVGDHIGCAETALTRMVGLLGRSGLQAGGGIWIRPSSGIHMFGMRFAIDAVGLDRHHRVVALWPNQRPNGMPVLSTRVRSVVELAAGEIGARAIELGHVFAVKQA